MAGRPGTELGCLGWRVDVHVCGASHSAKWSERAVGREEVWGIG